ncbi:maleate cis-trans isomerase family protein [Spirillospora sp. CA-128828]|uniref:maleate cis-trans isomerase family protein n=1 Tax=Spirillospora sp. CA-128828 TaxID=3240033 RepID=UPI003D89D982
MWRPDGWDVTGRIGVLTPHADVGPESELRAMAPNGVGVHASRVEFGAMRAGGGMDPTIPLEPVRAFARPPHVDRAAELLAGAPLQVIAFGFTSSGYLLGADGEAEMIDRLEGRTGGIPVVATCTAALRALRMLEARSIVLLDPPWFDEDLNASGARFFTGEGFDVVHHAPCGVRSDQRAVTPAGLYEWIRGNVPAGVDALFIGGNGFRAVGVIEALEEALGCAVLTANQVLFWHALRRGRISLPVSGYGRLFDLDGPTA